MQITEDEAEQFIRDDLRDAEGGVSDALEVEVTQPQFDALVCWTFNIGCEHMRGSTLIRLFNAGAALEVVAQQFARWNKAGGVVLAGLTRRRAAEKALFLS
jgi:lysozyme